MNQPAAESITPFAIVAQLAAQLRTVESEVIPLEQAVGRVSAGDVLADRDSPAADVSAMDGYAIRHSDAIADRVLQVVGEAVPGSPPPPAPAAGETVRIFTGAIVPRGCDLVIKREDVQEPTSSTNSSTGEIKLGDQGLKPGANIRRRGENAAANSVVLASGQPLSAVQIGVAANFGAQRLTVSKAVRVTIVVTGDEVLGVEQAVQPWQLRDSNGPTLSGLLQSPWLTVRRQRAADNLDALTAQLAQLWQENDAILLTGGVSMGDYDFVPQAAEAAGATRLFHRLPIRPGKPIYGAVGPQGQLLLGLPGNPVSASVGGVRFARPLLSKMAGLEHWQSPRLRAQIVNPDDKTLHLTWFRPVRIVAGGNLELLRSQGSGDLVALAGSDGFVEIPADQPGAGPWDFWSW